MTTTDYPLATIKRLKIKKLLRINGIWLLALVATRYLTMHMPPAFLLPSIGAFLWLLVLVSLYNFCSRKPFMTKTSRILQTFDQQRSRMTRWRRHQQFQLLFGVAACLLITLLLMRRNGEFAALDATFIIPFIGAYVGYNIGELFRIMQLKNAPL